MGRWWRKQNVAIKATIIAGCFGIIGSSITLLSPVIANIIDNNHKISVSMESKIIGGERFLSAYDPVNKEIVYSITTNSCLQMHFGESEVKTNYKNSGAWKGNLLTYFVTNKPIVIKKIVLVLLDYSSISPTQSFVVRFGELSIEGMGGGGGYTKKVYTPEVFIHSNPETYNLLETNYYELPENGSVIFNTPILLSEPGRYHIRIIPYINNYKTSVDITNIWLDTYLNWAIVPNIEIKEITEVENSINLKECLN